MDTKQVTVKLGSDSKQTKPTNTKKNNKTQPTVDIAKEFAKAKEENKTTLNLSKNNITVVPSSIKDLTNLVELYLYGNKINMLPPEIGNLTQLQTLALNENQVSFCFCLRKGLREIQAHYEGGCETIGRQINKSTLLFSSSRRCPTRYKTSRN